MSRKTITDVAKAAGVAIKTVSRVLNNEPRQRVILTRVKSIEVRFLDPVTRNWRNDWPPVTPNGPVSPLQVDEVLLLRPLAIEVSLVLEDWGRVRRLFEIPT